MAVGAPAPAPPSCQGQQGRATTQRRSADPQRDGPDPPHRGTLARLARPLWAALHVVDPVLPLEEGRHLGPHLGRGAGQADAAGDLDWETHHVDATVMRAHQHAAGQKRGPTNGGARPQPRRIQHQGPYPRRGQRQTEHLRSDAGRAARDDRLRATHGTRGSQAAGAGASTAATQADRGRQGLQQPQDSGVLAAARHPDHNPPSTTERRTAPFNRAIYRERNRVERLINRLKQWRRLATRYEKRATYHQAIWVIAATLLWL